MSITYGFYNSLNGDRRYTTEQISSIFDGIISDGVYSTIGNQFMIRQGDGLSVIVGSGRCWFNHTWTLNDTDYPIIIDESDLVLDRIDTIVIEVNTSRSYRSNSLKVIKGTPGSYPEHPKLTTSGPVYQYPLADVSVNAKATSLTPADITNRVGTSDCPFVTGVVTSVTVDDLLAQWEDQWNIWFDMAIKDRTNRLDELLTKADADIEAYKQFIQDEIASGQTTLDDWITKTQQDFDAWFANLQATLDGDVAAKLTKDVSNLQTSSADYERRISAMESKWDTLINDHNIIYGLEDSSGRSITDSEGNPIFTSVKYVFA